MTISGHTYIGHNYIYLNKDCEKVTAFTARFSFPMGLFQHDNQHLYIVDHNNNCIRYIDTSEPPAVDKDDPAKYQVKILTGTSLKLLMTNMLFTGMLLKKGYRC